MLRLIQDYEIDSKDIAGITCDGTTNNKFNEQNRDKMDEPTICQFHCVYINLIWL